MAQMQLPAYQVPRNALLDLSPINEGFDAISRTRQQNQENQFRTEQMGMERERMGMARDREARAARNEDADTIGKAALAFSALPEGQRNPAAWDRALRRHPDYANLPAEYKDPNRGPNLVAAEYGQYRKPEAADVRVVGNSLLRVAPNGQPQVLYTAPEKSNPIDTMIMERLGGRGQPQQPQTAQGPRPVAPGYQPMPQGGPRIQQQSNVGGDVMPGGVTRVSDPQGMPPQMPAQAPAPSRMIETPYGPMSEPEARELGGMMLLRPQFAQAGRAILDSIGPQGNPTGLQKPTITNVEEKQFNATEKLARLEGIRQTFDPKYLTGLEQAKQFGLSWQAWITGKLPPEQEKERSEYVRWQRRTIENVNATIKEITGAAMAVQEAERIRMQEPDLKNDPVQFKTLLDDTLNAQRLAIARYNFIRKNGLGGQPVNGPLAVDGKTTELGNRVMQELPLERMNGIIQERKTQIGREVIQQNPGVGMDKLAPVIRQKLRAELGIDA
jgi:hypothetical protein